MRVFPLPRRRPRPPRRLSSAVALIGAAVLAASGLTLAVAPAASAAVTSGTAYTVTNVNDGKCVDARAAGTANATAVQQYACNGTSAQSWVFTATSGGYFQVGSAAATAQVWDDSNVSSADGALVQLWTYGGGNNQQWLPVLESGSTYHFVNRFSGKCLDIPSASTADSVQLQQYSCNGTAAQSFNLSTGGGSTPPPGGFVVSQAQFNQMFPNRNGFYTYSGLTAALSAYPGFATTGSDTVKKQEAAAFLANVDHETGGLVYIVEINTANYPTYCDYSQPYGCPAGQAAYYGRGPLQISWNFNYKAAGDALGIDLLDNPYLVQNDASVAWKTGLWYWNTSTGAGTMTAHNAMVNGAGFGQTIRTINGSLECNGQNTAEMQDRINDYQQFTQILGVPAGNNLSC
ncbi:Predicted chitinase [Streptomyces sp. DvalAA-14]|uniref:glycoside hydrolase family 19 protein n=1 Tax=unclassified Streptomyces TaxID=2593676 RepID=UPI00081B65A3|nr:MULTISPECIES: glycoside hydrolase family 19 protein [unclassified Streptomyces]MYS21859.1 chitinase [Streptomyces sp. SID4948]SCE02477.1 Predicted chitinase [Streptomyces sp. DvalAA-14]